jgi:aminoglycoside phosphotransferase (APT) family kinase protein
LSESIAGIDVDKVTAWFEQHVPGVAPPLSFSLIAGGHSNLTFRVDDSAGGAWVLRRPPLGHVLATAHDMSREHRIISALGPTDVPVPPAVGLCSDESVNGAPFYVMEFVEGRVIRDAAAARELPIEARRRAGVSIADTLAKIHAVEPDEVGLGELGKKEGYIARQLKRWYGQWNQSKTRELPAIDEVHDALSARIPDQGRPSVVHGDYRLDNCMTDDDGNVIAVLDWEICTLGDPLADVGLLMVYWNEPDDEASSLPTAPTMVEGFSSRREVLDRYAEVSGRDLSDIDFYVAFGYWKLACIVEGVYARYVGGAMGSGSSGFEAFAVQVDRCAQAAADAVDRLDQK